MAEPQSRYREPLFERSLPQIRRNFSRLGWTGFFGSYGPADEQSPPKQIARLVRKGSVVLVETKFERTVVNLLNITESST
jgi:hypothetical protein